MTIEQTSVSQLEKFDRDQPGGCERRWYLEDLKGLKPKQGGAASKGDDGHELFAKHFKGEALPKRASMRKTVGMAIEKCELPKPGPDLLVELRLDGQEKFHATEKNEDGSPKWNTLDRERTIWLGGLPLDGFIDLTYQRGDAAPVVLDHKFSGEPHERALEKAGERGEKLIRGIQMPVYAHAMRRTWPDAPGFWLVHHYLNFTAGESFFRKAYVTVAQLDARIAEIAKIIERMRVLSDAPTQDEVPFNRKSCQYRYGCAMQSSCNAFRRNLMDQLSETEASLFDETPSASAPTPELFGEEDEEAKLERQLAEAKAKKIAAKKLADEAAAKAKADADAAEKKRKLPPIVDKSTTPDGPACKDCGSLLTPENASQRQDGAWKHVACKKAPQSVLPDDVPESKPELASERSPLIDALVAASPDGDGPMKISPPKRGPGRPPKADASSTPTVLTLELGPETLKALAALLSK